MRFSDHTQTRYFIILDFLKIHEIHNIQSYKNEHNGDNPVFPIPSEEKKRFQGAQEKKEH